MYAHLAALWSHSDDGRDRSSHSTIKAWLVECCRDGCLSGRFSHLEELWSSASVTIRFLITSLTKALLPRLLSLARWPALGIVLMVANFFYSRRMEATVFLGHFNDADMFWYPSPDLCLDTILSRSSTANSFDLIAWFLLWHALSDLVGTVGPYIDRCVPF